MGYVLSFLLLPTVFMSLGLCTGQMESFVHTVFFNSKGENSQPVNSYLLMMASTSPWFLTSIVLHFLETRLQTLISRKRLCQVLISFLAGGLYFALDMGRKSPQRVALSCTVLQFFASLTFSLLMSLTNDILNREGGLSKRVIVWGYCIGWFFAGMGFGRTTFTGFIFYKLPISYHQFSIVFLALSVVIVTLKQAPETGEEMRREIEASKKDIDFKPESTKKKKAKKSKESDSDSDEGFSRNRHATELPVRGNSSIIAKLHHTVWVSQGLLLYMIVRRIPGMLVSWKVAPDYFVKVGFNPMVGILGLPTFVLLSSSLGSFISATFITRHNILPTLKISSIAASLVLLPFVGLPLNVIIMRKFFRKAGMAMLAIEGLFSGLETGFLVMHFLEINSQLPENMRLFHLGLFAAMDRISTHILYIILSAVSDNVEIVYSAAIIAVSVVVNCIACFRMRSN